MGSSNPYNPFNLIAEFYVNAIEDEQFEGMRDMLSKRFNVSVDDVIAIEVFLLFINFLYLGLH